MGGKPRATLAAPFSKARMSQSVTSEVSAGDAGAGGLGKKSGKGVLQRAQTDSFKEKHDFVRRASSFKFREDSPRENKPAP